MGQIPPDLAGHPDRLRWNARYSNGFTPSFAAHPLAAVALAAGLPPGPVLELACGPSGSALLAAATARQVTAVDASEVALGLLGAEADRRGLGGMLTLVHADLAGWSPQSDRFALVLCTNFWDGAVFTAALAAVADGGLIAWEALTGAARDLRPSMPASWCVGAGEPASLLPADFDLLDQHDVPGLPGKPAVKRQILARRAIAH